MCALRAEVDSVLSANPAAPSSAELHPSASRSGTVAVESASVEERWDTGRTQAFSDGVLAIAITLLVLDLNVPASEFDDLWRGIVGEWPSYLAYASSFLTIGAIWLRHRVALPYVAAVGYLVIAVVLVLDVRGDQPKASAERT